VQALPQVRARREIAAPDDSAGLVAHPVLGRLIARAGHRFYRPGEVVFAMGG
jgi:hypothetical protein